MAYTSIFADGGVAAPANPALTKISNDFQPGQYDQVNKQIAASQKSPTQQAVIDLGAKLKAGQIDMPTYVAQFNKIVGNKVENPYSPKSLAGAVVSAGKKVLVDPFVNTAKMVPNEASLLTAEATHNNKAINNSKQALVNSSTGSLIGPLAQTAIIGGTNLAANKILNNPKLTPEQKQAALKDAINPSYNQAGFDIRDTGARAKLKQAGLIAQDIAVPALSKGGTEALGAARDAVAGESALGRAVNAAKGLVKRPPSAIDNLVEDTGKTASEASTKPTGTVAAPKSEPATPTGKTAGSALKAEQRAVQAGLTKEFEGKASYNEGSYKTEAENAVKLVNENPQEARDIALGNKPGNNAIHEVAVRRALENQALKAGDTETLRQIANSSTHTQTSEAAQRLGAEGFNADHNSPVDTMRAVKQAREAAVEKQTGVKIDQAVKDTTKEIKSSVPKVTRQNWQQFIESIKC